jgi:hypothetical protein
VYQEVPELMRQVEAALPWIKARANDDGPSVATTHNACFSAIERHYVDA